MQHAHNLGLSAGEEERLLIVEKVMVFAVSLMDAIVVFWVCHPMFPIRFCALIMYEPAFVLFVCWCVSTCVCVL